MKRIRFCHYLTKRQPTADKTAYTLRAYAFALRDIAFSNFFYPPNVKRKRQLIALLREKALEARLDDDLNECFRSLVALELTVFTPSSQLESVGDHDSFIAGICDGLQAADSKVLPYLHKIFQEPGRKGIDPKHALLIDNDAKVVSITARKEALDENQEIYYKVAVEPVQMAPLPNSG